MASTTEWRRHTTYNESLIAMSLHVLFPLYKHKYKSTIYSKIIIISSVFTILSGDSTNNSTKQQRQ